MIELQTAEKLKTEVEMIIECYLGHPSLLHHQIHLNRECIHNYRVPGPV